LAPDRYGATSFTSYLPGVLPLLRRRDGIIHRAGDIDDASLKQLLDSARGFIRHYSKELLDMDILQ
jgi:hypothetical protein